MTDRTPSTDRRNAADEPRDVLLGKSLREYAHAVRRAACSTWSDVVIPPYAGLDEAKCQLAAATEERLRCAIDELADLAGSPGEPGAEPFAVGDSVRVKGGYAPRRILSIVTAYRVTSAHNALNQSPATFEANDLERIEAQSPETKRDGT